ncbi:type II secretion system protein GspG [Luteolibacter flavescens]|uniref:Type II secretion system protein GspG n=1 Tax=Luteolibacter flavescens TaxID=1859460 RepID=A0ABT3FUD1_9BACT|nr:type II secretion system protein GspG [Luteolibacter flavescens]MCW1887193.1 type II secretion system protein GspG [Luteolibacter flavescens]
MRKSTFYAFTGLGVLAMLLTGFFVWFASGISSHPPEARLDGDNSSMVSAILMYCVNNGRPPTSAQGLEALVAMPTTGPKPRRWSKVWDEIPLDPWGTPYGYSLLRSNTPQWRFELRSAGRDRILNTSDDIAYEHKVGYDPDYRKPDEEEPAESRPSL